MAGLDFKIENSLRAGDLGLLFLGVLHEPRRDFSSRRLDLSFRSGTTQHKSDLSLLSLTPAQPPQQKTEPLLVFSALFTLSPITMVTVERIRQQVADLDKYDLPENFRDSTDSPRSTTAAVVDGALLERYVNLRDDYLQKSIANTVVKHVTTFDGTTHNFDIPTQTSIDAKELQAHKHDVQGKLQQLSRQVQTNQEQLHADFARLQERKEDLRKMLEEYEAEEKDRSFELDEDKDDDQGEQAPAVQEEDLQAQQERLLALQQRKKELLSKLHALQEEHRSVELASTEVEANLGKSYENEVVVEMEQENKVLQETIANNQEMATYFETMRLVTEEISGLRILSVEEGQSKQVDVLMKVEILQQHCMEIGLQADPQTRGLRVAFARLMTPSVVKVDIPTDMSPTIDLPIPVMDDLVLLAQPQPRSKALAFVIQEAIARIEMIHERAEELRLIYQDPSFRIETSSSTSNSFGRCDHEVIVYLPEFDVKVLVRMTPDCPRLAGSTFLDQISGPKSDGLKPVMQSSRRMKAKRPITLLRTLKKRLLEEQGSSGGGGTTASSS